MCVCVCVCVCVCANFIANFFWSQSLQMLCNMVTEKKGRDFEVGVGTQDKFWIQAVDLL